MVGHPRLDQHAGPTAAPRPARPDQPAGADEEGQRVVGGGEAGGQQVEVDVEEGHGGGPAHPVQDGLGPDEHRCASRAPVVGSARRLWPGGTGHLADLGAEERGQLFAQPAHAGPQRLHAQAAAVRRTPRGASRRSAGSAAPPRPRAAPRPRRSARTGPARRSGAQASKRAPPVRLNTQTSGPRSRRQPDRRARTGPAGRTPRRTGRCAGRRRGGPPARARAIPPAPAGDGARPCRARPARSAPPAGPARPGGSGAPSRRARSAHHVHRAVGGRALLPVGLVVRVEHDGGGQARHRRPGAAARLPTTTGQPARASAQSVVAGTPRRTKRPTSRSAHPVEGTSTSDAAAAGAHVSGRRPPTAPGRSDRWPAAGAPPSRPAACVERRGPRAGGVGRRLRPAAPGGGARRASVRTIVAGRRRPEEERGGSRPSARPPTRPVRPPLAAVPSPSHDFSGSELDVRRRRRRRPRRPPSRAPSARAAARGPGCRPRRRRSQRGGHGVVERLGDAPPPRCGRAPSAVRVVGLGHGATGTASAPLRGAPATLRARARPAGRPPGAWPPR